MIKYRWIIFLISISFVACAHDTVNTKGKSNAAAPAPPALDNAFAPKKIALLIGINNFDDKRWRSLAYAEKDARDFGTLLKDPRKGGFDDVIVLANHDSTRKSSILKALQDIVNRNSDPQDTVLIYFSTHGTLDRDSSGALKQFLVSSDSKFDDIRNTSIDLNEIRSMFGKLRSRRKVLILATCHSGQGKSELNDRMESELRGTKSGFFVRPMETVSEASVVLSACAWGETAREDDKLGHDIYTNFFLEALTKFDPNEDGAVTVSEAHDYAREKTYYYTKGQQRATAISDILGSDPIVLTGKIARPGKPIIYSYDERMNGVEVRVNGASKGKLPGCVVVDSGKQRIALYKQNETQPFFNRPVRLSEGANIDVKKMVSRPYYEDQSIGASVAYSSFINRDISEYVYGPMIAAGLNFGWKAAWDHTRWGISILGANQPQEIEIRGIDRELTVTMFDAETSLTWNKKYGALRLMGGPAAGVIYLRRNFENNFLDGTQYSITGSVGGVAGIEWAASKKIIPALTYRASYVPINFDEQVVSGFYHVAGISINYVF